MPHRLGQHVFPVVLDRDVSLNDVAVIPQLGCHGLKFL